MAHAVLGPDKHHGRRGDEQGLKRVVARQGTGAYPLVAARAGDTIHRLRCKVSRQDMKGPSHVELQTVRRSRGFGQPLSPSAHLQQALTLGVHEAKHHFRPGLDVASPHGPALDGRHRAAAVHVVGERFDARHEPGRALDAVLPPVHVGRVGVAVGSPEHDLVPRHAFPPLHPADGLVGPLQAALLLDVDLKVRRDGEFVERVGPGAHVAYALEFAAHGFRGTVVRVRGVRGLYGALARVDERRTQRGKETGPFFVGPVDGHEGCSCLDVLFAETS